MNKNEFISFIKHPENVQQDAIAALQQFTIDFPYCQTGQIVLAKAFHNSDDIAFENQLRLAAAYAADRKVLHRLILEKKTVSITEKVTELDETQFPSDAETTSGDISTFPNNSESHLNESKKSLEDNQKAPDTIDVTPTSSINNDIASAHNQLKNTPPSTIVETNSTTESIKPVKTEEDIFLEQQILSSAISSSLLLEVDEIDSEDITQNDEQPTVSAASVIEAGEHSFNEWLGIYANDAPQKKEETKPTAAKTDLINKFIKSEPQIRPKREFYSPANMARLSVKEDDDLVTETLAKIYAQQGNKEKAISAYEKLALKYPEKRIYFANQINKLGEEPK